MFIFGKEFLNLAGKQISLFLLRKHCRIGWNILIDWFTSNDAYVPKSEITSSNYVPNPGDFIQMNEHTAMVRYINSDEDVVCLDGNWGDRVVLSTRGNYKTFSGLNGYGRRSGLIENSWESVK